MSAQNASNGEPFSSTMRAVQLPATILCLFILVSAYSLFENDDRFRYLGFDIIDLGCCKCSRHPVWGAFTFVGTIFTTAPTTSPNTMEL